ncbi:SpoIID/LytB domain-containing protein [Cellulomonas algicola]|uniref:SpoIID/LytB domain-containing protein n=1 Tax=Cellulomonas algicola TaxID=2071633 RepID=UPI001C3FA0C8|nr:SpoIID/LytB domain-containing protein [Cellulomonas algicola]
MTLAGRLVAAAATLAIGVTTLVALSGPANAAEEVYPVPASGAWTVDGRAFGHGRGMSQWGAQAQALQGRSAAQILDFYYPGTGTATQPASTYVKTSLVTYTPASSVTVWAPEGRTIRMGTVGSETFGFTGRWTITVSGQTVTAQRRDAPNGAVTDTRQFTGVFRMESLDEYGMVIAASQGDTSGRWYRGDIRIEPTSGTAFNVTNSLPMEGYLRSVVPRESPASWGAAALQAQAVAARTYAQWKVDHGSALCDTTTCQVYAGRGTANAAGTLTASNEDARSDAAIAATAGQVRTYNGAAAFTEFSSSNGGWTTAGGYPYQIAQQDPWTGSAPGDTVSRWTASLPVSTVAAQCPSNGTLRALVVTSRTGNGELGGRVLQARVDCSTGSRTIATPAFGLRSSWWRPRPTTPALEQVLVSSSAIDHGGQFAIGATPNVPLSWTLTVVDRSTGRLAATVHGSAQSGVRFNANWFGTYDSPPAGASPYVGPGTYDLTLSAQDDAGNQAAPFRTALEVRPPADPAPQAEVALRGAGSYVPLTPTRVLDTRDTFSALGGGRRADVVVAGKAGVPADASAVVLNVTAVGTSVAGHLRVWPAGSAMPNTSVVNTDPARVQASLVTVALGGGGAVSVYNPVGTTHYLVDVLGYYTTGGTGARYTAVDPVRAFDSRYTGQQLTDGAPRTIDVAAALDVPAASLSAVTVNVTTTRAQGNGYVVAYGGGGLPTTSTVNLQLGADVANRAVVPVVNGTVTLALKGAPADAIVDIGGWYGAPGGTSGALFTPITPTRVLDTRLTTPLGPTGQRVVPVPTSVVPTGATAVAGTVTAVNQTAPWTHARVWPAGLPLTPTSDLNSTGAHTQANAVVVRLGAGGAVAVYNDQGTSHLLLDVVGYFG